MPPLHQDENKTCPFLLKKKEAAAPCLRGADSPAIGRCSEEARLCLWWPWDGQVRENTWKSLRSDLPSIRSGGSTNPICSCSLWCEGTLGHHMSGIKGHGHTGRRSSTLFASLVRAMIKGLRFFPECSSGIASSPNSGCDHSVRKAESFLKHLTMVTLSVW